MKITINIPDHEAPFFMELLRRFNFVEVVKEEQLSDEQKQFVQDLREALHDVEAHQAGTKGLKTAKQLWDEL